MAPFSPTCKKGMSGHASCAYYVAAEIYDWLCVYGGSSVFLQNRLLGNRLPCLPCGQTIPAVVTDCLTCELRSLRQFIFYFDRSASIMTVFVFYGYW